MNDVVLSKRKLLDAVARGLEKLGYARTRGPLAGAALILHKHTGELVLSLGVEVSKHYSDRFTGSFYLSRSHEWAYVVKGYPRQGYQRVGHFLTHQERTRLLDAEFQALGVVDAWWIGFSERSAKAFLAAVEFTEERFMSQEGLRDAILECESLTRHWSMVQEVIRDVRSGLTPQNGRYQPKKYPKDVPRDWFMAAESVLVRSRPEAVNTNYVGLLAVDAWRAASCAPVLSSAGP